jgi:radical SAM superfamily enzyme YgiQ (UPF0313 family)
MEKKTNLSILLISPKGDIFSRSGDFEDFARGSREMQTVFHFFSGLGLGLTTIAALTPAEHTVRIIDENQEAIDFDTPCDIVGITGMTQQAHHAYKIAEAFTERNRYVVMGGIHATCASEEVRSHVDTVFLGEAENTWPQFIEDFVAGDPRPVYDQRDFPKIDMSRIPCPRFELVAKYNYPVVWIQSTRGCPHDCEFCAASKIYGRKYKRKEVDQVIREIEEVKKYWKFAQIGFADDNMFTNKTYSRGLIDRFKTMNFNWYAQSDIAIAKNERLLKDLHACGCRMILIGFESVIKKNLRGLDSQHWKEKMSDKYPLYIDRIQRSGIGIYGTFILGLEEDTRETVDRTIEFVQENHMMGAQIMGAQITILTPFPGSRLRARLKKENRIIHSDWLWYTGWNPVIRHKNFTEQEFQEDLLRFYKSIYDPEKVKLRAKYFRDIFTQLV